MDLHDTLSKGEIHKYWESVYEDEGYHKFSDVLFKKIKNYLRNGTILDAGCGNGNHTLRLARLGFSCHAVDISESVLHQARERIHTTGLSRKVSFSKEDIMALSFPDESFDNIVCLGVLMHIPQIEIAIKELSRVLKRKGILVIGENNKYALESIMKRMRRKFFIVKNYSEVQTSAGTEYWVNSSFGPLMTRESNILNLISLCESYELKKIKRMSGTFTEAYIKFQNPIWRTIIHFINTFYFSMSLPPSFALGNIIIFEKQ